MNFEPRKYLFASLVLIFLISLTSAADWYDTDWDYRKNITFNQSQIEGSNEDFPALINLTDTDLKEKAQNDGDDILFTSSNGTFKLDHEIENYDNSTGELTAHVKVLNMTNQSQTSVFMYYGNSEASNQENATEVWSNGYEGVYHLDEEQSGTGNSAVYKDATSNNRHGEDEVSATGRGGKIGNGTEFDGSDDYIGINDEFGLDATGVNYTVTGWVRTKSEQSQFWLSLENDFGSPWQSDVGYTTEGYFSFYDGSSYNEIDQITNDKWAYLSIVHDTSRNPEILGYKNGSLKATLSDNHNDGSQTGKSAIGDHEQGGGLTIDGYIDEVRVSSVKRPGYWLSTTYRNQKDSDSFYTIGSEEESGRTAENVQTFENGTDTPRSFFANDTVATIRTQGAFSSDPSITVNDSQGNVRVNGAMMTNVSGTYEYNFTVNQSVGWYDVEINGDTWENVFYQGEKWENNFTDSDGNKYTFRRKVNVSEPGVSDRWFEPIDTNVDFGFSPDNDSIRVVAWNGSRMLEVPSQIHNVSQSGGSVSNANIVFLSSMNQSENRTYYVVSAKSEYKKNYGGLNNTDNTLDEKVENSYFKSYFNQSYGYLLRDLKDSSGSSKSLSGTEPMDRYPEVIVPDDLGTEKVDARSDFTAEINVTEGPLFTDLSVDGGLDGSTNYPYSVDCSIYAANPYMKCEKNLSTSVSENWQNLYFNGLVFEDGKFSWFSYRNSTGDISTTSISSGDNSDTSGLDSNMTWVTFFDNSSADAVAEIFLEKDFSVTDQADLKLQDDSNNDFFQQTLIDDKNVNSGDYWYTETARLIYNGLRDSDYVNDTYNELDNPVTTVKGKEITDDKDVVNYSNTGNVSTNDTDNVKVHSYWEDDTFLDYAKINVTGNGENGSNTELYFNDSYDIRESGDFTNTSWVNLTLDNSTVNAGEISANISVFDVAGKSNSTLVEFNVSDATPPQYSSVIKEPNTSADLDPRKQINVTANISEYSNVSTAFLYYKNDSVSNYSTKLMSRDGETNFVYTYKSNFTPQYEDNYTYYVSTNDTEDQSKNSSDEDLEIAWDYTWNFDPSLSGETDTFNQNVSIGNFTINNTGDFNQTFKLSSGVFNSRTWVNGSQLPANFEVEGNGSTSFFDVNATTRDSSVTEGVDTFNLTVENSSASPQQNFTAFDVTTSTGGPFLFTEITEYNSTVTQGDSGVKLTAETTNKGNETANKVNITFKLPSDWAVSEEETLVSGDSPNLNIGTTKSFTTKVDVASDASTGTKTLEATARSEVDNRSTVVDVTVESSGGSGNNNENGGSGSGGGGGGGGSGGAGAGGTGLSSEQQEKLFQTEESFELVRGEDQEFPLTVENPFEEGRLENVSVNVSGFLSQYLSTNPKSLDRIQVNESRNFTINVEAPRYFNRGEYDLEFNISGINNKSELIEAGNNTFLRKDTREFKESRNLDLTVHEIPRNDASKALNQSKKALQELVSDGMADRELNQTLEAAEEALETGNYQKARQLSEEIQEQRKQAENAEKTIQEVESLVEDAEYRGLDSPRTKRMVSMAETALERGDYSMAAERASEAETLYAVETKGETNYVNYTKRNWKKLSLAFILVSGLSLSGFLRFRLFRIKRKLGKLEEEEETLLGLMKQVQRESFEEGKMSMEEYEEAMMQYEKQLSQNVKQTIKLETRKQHWHKIRKTTEIYEKERNRIQKLMQETQEKYLEEGELDTRVYKQKMQTFRERLTELEGKLAEKEAQKQLKTHTTLTGRITNAIPV